MHLDLRDQQLKIITYIQIAIYKPLSNNKPSVIDTHMKERKEFKYNTKDSHQIKSYESKRKRNKKEPGNN